MMQLKKNQPAFEVVDGPFRGRKYVHVVDYKDDDIPPAEKAKFIAVKMQQPAPGPQVPVGDKAAPTKEKTA